MAHSVILFCIVLFHLFHLTLLLIILRRYVSGFLIIFCVTKDMSILFCSRNKIQLNKIQLNNIQ